VFGWGTNANGQLGTGVCSENYQPGTGDRSTTECEPILIDSLKKFIIIHIAAGGAFSTFITRKGEVLTCGNDNKGQLGIDFDPSSKADVPLPTIVPSVSGSPINNIYCGLHHAFAVSKEQ